jgi:formylglycine-generating enzyme required for sulfatase activity
MKIKMDGDKTVTAEFKLSNFIDTVNGYPINMVLVKRGTFEMGCTEEPAGDCGNDETKHRVTLSKDYYIGKFEVTQGLWKAVTGDKNNQSFFEGDNLPVESVSWDQVQTFITKLNTMTAGRVYGLPAEAQWEFAARGGKSGVFKYSGSDDIVDVAWYGHSGGGTSGYGTNPVGQKKPNELGIHDMSGNVWEWVNDYYEPYGSDAQIDPAGPQNGSFRVIRGGSWNNGAGSCRVSNRNYIAPGSSGGNIGFRLVFLSP